jgi:hypothetical protein
VLIPFPPASHFILQNYPPFVSEKSIDGTEGYTMFTAATTYMDININCTDVNIDKDLRGWLELAAKKYGDTFRTKLFGMVSSLLGLRIASLR